MAEVWGKVSTAKNSEYMVVYYIKQNRMKMAGAIELGFTRISYANAGFPDDCKLEDEQSHKIVRNHDGYQNDT